MSVIIASTVYICTLAYCERAQQFGRLSVRVISCAVNSILKVMKAVSNQNTLKSTKYVSAVLRKGRFCYIWRNAFLI